jgi:uncharacterized membrane protein YkoI
MLKKCLTGRGIATLLISILLLGSLGTMTGCAATLAQGAGLSSGLDNVEEQVGDQNEVDEQQPQYTGSIAVDESQFDGLSEADEAAALESLATISSAEAEAAALAANPGTTIVKTELNVENGFLVYSVELSNGTEVKVDAGNGEILYTEQADSDGAEVDSGETAPEQEAPED